MKMFTKMQILEILFKVKQFENAMRFKNGDFNPIQAGGGGAQCAPPTGFFLAVLKRLAVV